MKENYHPIKINFTKEEHELATETARKCGLTVVELCRILLRNRQPKPIPDRAYRETLDLLYELHNQIKDDEMAAKLRAVILNFQRRMQLPERGELGTPQSLLCGEEEHPRSGKPFVACGKSESGG